MTQLGFTRHTSIMLRTLYRKVAVISFVLATPLAAQVPAPGSSAAQVRSFIDGRGLRDQLRARIAAAGLTPDAVRQRLAQLGYDPSTLDPYLAETGEPAAPEDRQLAALRALAVPGVELPAPVSQPQPPSPEERREDLRVFGLEVFARATTEFQPVTTGPVPPTYVIGPGDELVLILTGDVEYTYTLPVTRDGFIVIPQVGQVWASGVTLERLREQMYNYLGRAYSGVRRGPGATTRFELTLGRLRTNQIFVTGEVARPGSYLLSPLASVLNGLYYAGGPTANGSFRDVQIVRNGRVVRRVDLYDYLLHGNNLGDVRLEPGDVIFVPRRGIHVSVRGTVARPAIYEVARGENLFHAIRNAGGITAETYTRRARITRILPPADRTVPGVDRVVLDIPLEQVLSDSVAAPPLHDGDDVGIAAIRGEIRNTVTLEGAVWRPGTFVWRLGLRVWDIIREAQGLTPSAYRSRAHITRRNLRDSTLVLLSFSLDTLPSGQPLENPELEEFDAVRVYDVARPENRFPVTISGEVYDPLSLDYREGMTLRDLVIQAGGLRPTADLQVEIARLVAPEQRSSGRVVELIHVPLDSSFVLSEEVVRRYLGYRDSLVRVTAGAVAARFQLQPFDIVTVRRVPDFTPPRSVVVTGEVRYPGRYVLQQRNERLSDVIGRAGGLTSYGYADGFRLYRNGSLVAVRLERALRGGAVEDNPVLEAGDSLHVPEFEATVRVQGAVASPTTVLYRPGAGLGHYIENAGGYARLADAGRVSVRYANGETRVRKRVLLLFRSSPEPGPGSVVTVPARDASDRFDLRGFLSDVIQIAGSVATIIIVANR